jgi:predicted porin
MKKSLLALAALTLVAGTAAAQSSVVLYGNIDIGVLTQNKAVTDNAPKTTVANGGISPSIWGMRGSEDLGGGLKAVFNLEGHFSADTGQSDPRLFRRQSNIGLSSATLGTVTLGNMYSPAILAFAATDPRGLRENFSGLYPWAYNSGALTTGNNGNNDVGVFLQNAVAYSNKLGPVAVNAGYSVSERRGSLVSLGLVYTGPLTVSAAYQGTNLAGTNERGSELATIGAAYSVGALTGKLNYLRGENKNAALVETSKVGVLGLGVDYKTSPANTVAAAVYYGKNKTTTGDKTRTLILSDEYALSKRTTLYGTFAYADADDGASLLTTMVAGGTRAGAKTSLFNVGIKHSF